MYKRQVYAGRYYGTLKSEIQRINAEGKNAIIDVDVAGGVNVKKIYGDQALSIFVMPPSVEELRRRLVGRATDSEADIQKRVDKAEYEMSYAPKYDKVVVKMCIRDRANGVGACDSVAGVHCSNAIKFKVPIFVACGCFQEKLHTAIVCHRA